MMKKITIGLFFAMALLSRVNANDSELFSYDANAVKVAVSELTALENYVTQNQSASIDVLVKTSNLMVNGIMLSANPFSAAGDPPLGIPSFIWGCGLGVAGLVIVYIVTDNDRPEVKKALWGCVTGTAISLVIYFVLIATVATTTVTTYP